MNNNKLISNNKAIKRLLEASDVLDAISSSYLITNNKVQIVYCNNAFLNNWNINSDSDVKDLKPGDVFQCTNAISSKHGCGSHPKCRYCNFRNCILESLEDNAQIKREAIINNANNKMTALLITATPFVFENETFVSISTIDITDRKKKDLMESVFFHDLINLAGSLHSYLDVLENYKNEDVIKYIPTVKQISSQVLDEIISHRELSKAEDNKLEVEISPIDLLELIESIKDIFTFHPSKKEKELLIITKHNITFETDRNLIERTLINLIKNAFEAVGSGSTVTLKVIKLLNEIIFEINNPGIIPEEAASQIFTYGYSTKGNGRGIGTYSIKLLGENFLKGKVWFESDEKNGTSFFFKIPIRFDY